MARWHKAILACVSVALMTGLVVCNRSDVMRTHRQNHREEMNRRLVGQMVITKYNNKTYRIDDIDYTKSPMSTFDRRDGPVSFMDYYKSVVSSVSL